MPEKFQMRLATVAKIPHLSNIHMLTGILHSSYMFYISYICYGCLHCLAATVLYRCEFARLCQLQLYPCAVTQRMPQQQLTGFLERYPHPGQVLR